MSNFSINGYSMYNNSLYNGGYSSVSAQAGKNVSTSGKQEETYAVPGGKEGDNTVPVGQEKAHAVSGKKEEAYAVPGKQEEEEKERKERLGIKDPTEECQTCKNRKYQDGSDEMVSFKSAAHISPESAASAVRAHEQEHVSNAYKKAATDNGKVISASVSIHTAVCPECGRTYVSGGTTHTQIKYYNEDNPYQKDLKLADQTKYSGMHTDYAV